MKFFLEKFVSGENPRLKVIRYCRVLNKGRLDQQEQPSETAVLSLEANVQIKSSKLKTGRPGLTKTKFRVNQ